MWTGCDHFVDKCNHQKIKQKTLVKREVSRATRRGEAKETRSPGRAEELPFWSIWSPKVPSSLLRFPALESKNLRLLLCPRNTSYPSTHFGLSNSRGYLSLMAQATWPGAASLPHLWGYPATPSPGCQKPGPTHAYYNPTCTDWNCVVHSCSASSYQSPADGKHSMTVLERTRLINIKLSWAFFVSATFHCSGLSPSLPRLF